MHMTRRHSAVVQLLLAAALSLAVACTSGDGGGTSTAQLPKAAGTSSTPAPTSVSAADPFAYCAQVRTIDAPDARYTGEKVPPVIAEGIKKTSGAAADAPLEVFTRSTSWRCMDGKVYACTVGANLPCSEKADLGRAPSAALSEFCKTNADAAVIPAAVTGRATVYAWRCSAGVPEVVRQVFEADQRGFIANIWHEIPRP
jgi:hypothetical protein